MALSRLTLFATITSGMLILFYAFYDLALVNRVYTTLVHRAPLLQSGAVDSLYIFLVPAILGVILLSVSKPLSAWLFAGINDKAMDQLTVLGMIKILAHLLGGLLCVIALNHLAWFVLLKALHENINSYDMSYVILNLIQLVVGIIAFFLPRLVCVKRA
ncbi:MAG: hypothetical protein COB66_06345 [Coxiella sp. (in: Bacteria)]|nr:MAG: hypothetical protein COB66_06345 [Coxiella sp. (in: g-proteobacteria)]